MLSITITPTRLYFNDLSDDMFSKLKEVYILHQDNKRNSHFIEDSQEKLFKVLLKLSYEYDIELN